MFTQKSYDVSSENIFKGSYNRSDIYVKKTSSRKKKIKNYL